MSTTTRQGHATGTPVAAINFNEFWTIVDPDANIGYHKSVYFFDSNPDKTVRLGGTIGPSLTPAVLYLIVVPTGTGNIRWSGNYDYGLQGTEVYNNTTGALAATTTAVVINVVTRIALAIAGLTAGDQVGIEFTGDLDAAANTVSYHVLGVEVQ